MAALTNNQASLDTQKDAATTKLTSQQTAQGKLDDTLFVNTVLSRQGNPETMTVMNASGVDALVANLVAASNPRAQSAANMRCRINDDEPFIVLSSAEQWEQLKRTQYFFPVRFQGADTSMMELVIQCLRKLECSTVIYEVLRDTPFLESPAQILHDIGSRTWGS